MASNEIVPATAEEPCCPVCYDTFTTQLRKPICCPKCNYNACIKCVQRYLLTIINDPHCMNCNFGWTRRFQLQNLSKSFMDGEWAEHRRQILWRHEEAYLPESQIVAERIVRGRNMDKDLEPLRKRRDELQRQVDLVEAEINLVYRKISRLQAGLDENGGTAAPSTKALAERKAFVRRCTHPDCNGFLSTAWKCGICENYSCSECLVVKGKDRDTEHTCKPDDIATAQLIAKDTKMCPKCGEGIYRTEGCSQMFCTSCKTPFDWNTGKIISGGLIHNPHYFAYMREQGNAPGRAVGDIQCGGLPPLRSISRLKKKENNAIVEQIYRSINHTIDVEARAYNAHIEEVVNQDYRVKFLLKEMNKEDIERILMNQERKRERHRVIREVLDTFGNIGAEIFRRFVVDADSKVASNPNIYDDLWPQFQQELEALRDYCNKELMDISYYYKCAVPQWRTDDWGFFTESDGDMKRRERARIAAVIAEAEKSATAPATKKADAVSPAIPPLPVVKSLIASNP